jgi:hypothetical protein
MKKRTSYNWRKHVKNNASKETTNKEMVKELNLWMDRLKDSVLYIEEHTGKITKEDVLYHVDLISRIINHKY